MIFVAGCLLTACQESAKPTAELPVPTEPAPVPETPVDSAEPTPPASASAFSLDTAAPETVKPLGSVPADEKSEAQPAQRIQNPDYPNLASYPDGDLNTWVRFETNEGFYRAAFPIKPAEHFAFFQVEELGPTESHMHYVRNTNSLNSLYLVSYHDYSGLYMHSDSTHKHKTFFNDQRLGLEKSTQGEILETLDKPYGVFPGRQFVIRKPTGELLVVRTVLCENRLFGLHVETDSTHYPNPLLERFLTEFHILPFGT